MRARLVLAIISTLLEETAIVVVARWGLPRIGVNIPVPVLVTLMIAWAAYAVVTYRIGSRALRRKPVLSLPDMVGSRGEVVSRLAPEGLVKIKGELWVAKSTGGEVDTGEEITVMAQERLKLVVSPDSSEEGSPR